MFSPKTRKELKDAIKMCLKLSDDCSNGLHGPIGTWDVSQVIDMSHMFSSDSSFNGDISNWDVSRVTDMGWMFEWAGSFNGDISNWDVSRATNMNAMFYYATSFNVDISNWDVSRVTNMNLMFVGVWSKITSKHCSNTRDDRSFSTLAAAKAFCLQQGPSICSGVYDDRCDGKGSFLACKLGGFASSSMGSCIYTTDIKGWFMVKYCFLC